MGVVVLAGALLAVTVRPVSPYRFGEGVGRLACFAALAGLGASWFFQRGRRLGGWLVVGGFAALVGGAVVAVLATTPDRATRPERLGASDVAPLVSSSEDGRSILAHPSLGFRFPHPGADFAPLDEAELQRLARGFADPGMHIWGWFDQASGSILLVGLLKGMATERDLRSFQDGVAQAFGETPGSSLAVDRVGNTPEGIEGELRGGMPDGSFVAARSRIARLPPAGRSYLLALFAFTADQGALDFVLEGLRVR
ncbi:MAG: hypothetical protein HY905_10880 [Deltaproteobacteria bacterium]|nr:hypothetical protein [Deltaproteobacteria bacterium]